MKNSKLSVIILAVLLVVCVVGSFVLYNSNASKIATLEASEAELMEEVETFKTDLAAKEAENAELNNEVSSLGDALEDTKSDLEDVTASLETKNAALESALALKEEWAAYIEPNKIIGEWEVAGYVDHVNEFDPSSSITDPFIYGVKFTNNNASFKFASGYEGNNDWIDDHIFSETAMGFMIRDIDGVEYLFLEWKSGDYIRDNSITYYVFKKAN